MAKALDHNAEFERFVRHSRAALRLRAWTMCGDWQAADDLVQEALIIMHRRWDGVEPAARSSYLRTVIAHLLAHERASARWRRESVRDVLPAPGSREEEATVDRLAIQGALASLPRRQRDAIHLRYWRGLGTDEIARILSIPCGTVRSDLSRAMAGLRMALLPSFPERRTADGLQRGSGLSGSVLQQTAPPPDLRAGRS
jgi:RNA polymerase sigma factor (sigma-70 family)